MAELLQAPHTVASEAVGRQATAVVRPEIMGRHTIPQDGAREILGSSAILMRVFRGAIIIGLNTTPLLADPRVLQLEVLVP